MQFYTFFKLGEGRGGWSTPRPGRFTSTKETRYPFYKTLGVPHGLSGRLGESPHDPGFDPQTVQAVANRYTAFDILSHGEARINTTLWRVRVNNVAVPKQYVLHILSVIYILGYTASNAHAPYYIVLSYSSKIVS